LRRSPLGKFVAGVIVTVWVVAYVVSIFDVKHKPPTELVPLVLLAAAYLLGVELGGKSR